VSIVLYALVYALLFVVWLRLLNRVIQRGPEVPVGDGTTDSARSVLDTATQRTAGVGADRGMFDSATHVPTQGV